MSHILRLPPNFTATNTDGKIDQIRTYLYQVIKDIEYSLNSLDSTVTYTVEARETDGTSMFSVLKPLIIKSGDIVNSYYSIIKSRLDDVYVSKSEYSQHHMVSGSITDYAESTSTGITYVATNTNTTGLPDSFGESVGTVHKISEKRIILLTDLSTGKMASRTYSNSSWSGWRVISPE